MKSKDENAALICKVEKKEPQTGYGMLESYAWVKWIIALSSFEACRTFFSVTMSHTIRLIFLWEPINEAINSFAHIFFGVYESWRWDDELSSLSLFMFIRLFRFILIDHITFDCSTLCFAVESFVEAKQGFWIVNHLNFLWFFCVEFFSSLSSFVWRLIWWTFIELQVVKFSGLETS
jgi:hypothetical protein